MSYNNACAEVSTILSYLNKEEFNKIPLDIIQAIEANKSPEYIYKFDEKTELKEQKMLPETKAILYNLFRDYLCTEKQREIIKRQQAEERAKNEMIKQQTYSTDVFASKHNEIKDEKVKENARSTNDTIQRRIFYEVNK